MDLISTHVVDVSQMKFLPLVGKRDHTVILFKFMVDIVCQAVARHCPNAWQRRLKAINSAVLTENWKIDFGKSSGLISGSYIIN